ncbi:MAG: hypothetical protein C1943_00100 [Halochromatium sp.]|nr:hypothetical protein [Halochromatium sp.]
MGHHDAERIIPRRPSSLPALPQALGALYEQVENDDFSPSDVVDILRYEPSLLLLTLRLAPAALSPAAPISDHLSAAVTTLGKAGLELLISTMLARHLECYLSTQASSELSRRWRQSVSTALCAKHLAARFDPAQAELAYLCGLLRGFDQLSDLAPLQPIMAVMAYAERPLAELEQALPLTRLISIAGSLSLDLADSDGAFVNHLLARHAGLSPEQLEQARVAASAELAQLLDRFSLRHGRISVDSQDVEAPLLPTALIGLLSGRLQAEPGPVVPEAVDGEAATPWPWLAQVCWARHEIAPLTVWRLADDKPQPMLSCCYTSVSATHAALVRRLPATDAHAPGRAWLGRGDLYLGIQTRADASLADQQLLDILGTPGLLCLRFGTEQEQYVLMGGMAQAVVGADQKSQVSELRKLAESLLPGPRQGHHQAAAQSTSRSASVLDSPSDDLSRLMLHKTVHEIRTPLSVMKTYLVLLKQKMPESESLHSELEILGEEIDRVTSLLGQLTESAQEEPRQWVSVNQLVTNLLALVGKQHPSAEPVQIRSDLDPELPAIFSQPDRIKQILLNLVKNALEAQPDGGALEVITRVITQAGTAAPAGISLRIRDQGPGLSDAIRARLFEPFNSSKSDQGTGSSAIAGSGADTSGGPNTGTNVLATRGLGLHIVRSAVASLGGQIQVSSRSGEGTTFVVELPILDPAPAHVVAAASPETLSARGNEQEDEQGEAPQDQRLGEPRQEPPDSLPPSNAGEHKRAGRVVAWAPKPLPAAALRQG